PALRAGGQGLRRQDHGRPAPRAGGPAPPAPDPAGLRGARRAPAPRPAAGRTRRGPPQLELRLQRLPQTRQHRQGRSVSRTILDVHVLQTVPPSNINRDDTGSPKGAVYGGVRRARVSSQAWKRATREAFKNVLDPAELGTRTKRVADLVAERIRELDADIPYAEALELAAATVAAATGSKIEKPKRRKNDEEDAAPESSYLMFLSARQRDGLAELAVQGRADIKAFLKDPENKKRAKQIANTGHSIDIALFGRMVADSSDINVDASAQVAHAISVHAADIESDYYTAVDDRRKDDEPGAGMIGTVEFNAATLYRYAAVDVDLLSANLGAGLRDDQ